jgi:RNA polymerase sigma-70 factor (ECF subfamily)
VLDRIYLENRQQLFTCALAITRSPELAEDAVQEAFCRLFRLDRRPRHPKAYVFRAVMNAARDQVRRAPPASAGVGDLIFDPSPGPSAAVEEQELRRQIARALLMLSDDERETIVQRIYGGLTFREIARVREAPMGTVAAWYRRGLEKLKRRLEE